MKGSSASRRSRLALRLAVLAFIVGLCAWCWGPITGAVQYGIAGYREARDWRLKTTPLERKVVDDMCLQFSIEADDPRCQPGAEVYAPDFFRDITRAFREHDGVWSTYEQVRQRLGTYEYKLEPPVTTGQGLTYFRAWYDLRGDRVFPITMFFYEDGRLFRIIADVGD